MPREKIWNYENVVVGTGLTFITLYDNEQRLDMCVINGTPPDKYGQYTLRYPNSHKYRKFIFLK